MTADEGHDVAVSPVCVGGNARGGDFRVTVDAQAAREPLTPAVYTRMRDKARVRLDAFPAADMRLAAMDALIDAERDIAALAARLEATEREREGYKRDFLAARERSEQCERQLEAAETREREAVSFIERVALGDYSGFNGAVARAQAFLTERTAALAAGRGGTPASVHGFANTTNDLAAGRGEQG